MDTKGSEQALRQEAIRRRLQGETRREICRSLQRSPRWFNKWWRVYRAEARSDLADRARTPHTSPHQLSTEVVQAVVNTRHMLVAAQTAETRYGLIGHRAIQGRLRELGLRPLPSLASIQRILQRQGLTQALGAGEAQAYYPWPMAWAVNAIQATDIITRHVRGGETIENFHTIDHASGAVCLSQHAAQTSATACAHLLESWAFLGLPSAQQFDNAGAFCGGHTHPRVIGQVVRLCLFCGVEPFFIPVYEAKRNYQIETFHSLWLRGFWSRGQFRNLAHVQREAPAFQSWCYHHYRPPALDGQTPAQARRGQAVVRLSADLRRLIPAGRLPIMLGRFHLMRRVNSAGYIELLNDRWRVGPRWAGQYVRATINTARPCLTIWHQADEQAAWRLLHTRAFRLKETVHELLPAFRRNRARCLEHWPD